MDGVVGGDEACPSYRSGELRADTALLGPPLHPEVRLRGPLGAEAPCALRWPRLCHGLLLCPPPRVTTMTGNARDPRWCFSSLSVLALDWLCGSRGLTPRQCLFDEICSVVSSTAALEPGPNPKPDNGSSLAMMVDLVNMKQCQTL